MKTSKKILIGILVICIMKTKQDAKILNMLNKIIVCIPSGQAMKMSHINFIVVS